MSIQSNLDALIWAAASTDPATVQDATEILEHAKVLQTSTDKDLPSSVAARTDELVARATEAAAGSESALATLRVLVREIMEADSDGPEEASGDALGDTDDDEDLLVIFLAACSESLKEIESNLLGIEDDPDSQDAIDSIDELKRSIHTLKGECGVLSLHVAQSIWHEAESLIEASLDGTVEFPVKLVFAALDWHREYLSNLESNKDAPPPESAEILGAMQRQVTALASGEGHGPSEPAPSPPEDDGTLVQFSEETLNDETVPEFVTEATQHLEDSEAALLELEEDPDSSEVIDRIFRAFHTIKGVAGFLSLDPVTRLAHNVETLLDRFRGSGLTFTSVHADVVLEGKDMMTQLLAALGGAEGPSVAALDLVIEHVGKIADDPGKAEDLGSATVKKTLEAAGLLGDAAGEPVAPSEGIAQLGDILVAQGKLTQEQLDLALASQASLRAQGHKTRVGEVLVSLGVATSEQIEHALAIQGAGSSVSQLLEAEIKPKAPPAAPASSSSRKAKAESTIRVSTQRLDALVDMVGELVIAQQMVVQGSRADSSGTSDRLDRNLSQLGKITRDLQEASMSLRMVTFRSTFQKMNRLVRDVANRAEKSIKLVIEGADTEVDRNVVDRISDPLVHLVRNAVDHGVEGPDERVQAGKSRQGRVVLSARHQGGAIVISLKDDGRGLDREKIAAKACERGLIRSMRDAAEMSDSAIFKMIFEAGFSTAAAVTDISGRGVGMDVVKRNIEAMRGKVEIASKPGEGAEFKIQLPLTLAIIDAMIVRARGERYVIPTLSIVQSFRPNSKQLHGLRCGEMMVEVRGQLVPVYRLESVLEGGPNPELDSGTTLILVEGMGRRVCLVVDEIIGQQQVVIKKLGACASDARVVSGGAILGDGRVALIVDVEGILAETESVSHF